MNLMKAVRITEYGDTEVLNYEDLPRPEVEAGKILVKNFATTVNPADTATRAGYLKELVPFLPLVLGWDFAGKVVAVGEGVKGFEIGDEVYGMVRVRGGTYAEYLLVEPNEVAKKPATIDFNEAAAMAMVGLTAWQALFDTTKLQSGQRVLVQGASGAVGSLAVQFAKSVGAYVIGTAATRNLDFVRSIGADEVIDYQTTVFEEKVKDVDVVLDTVSGEIRERSWRTLKPGGVLVGLLMPEPKPDRPGVRGAVVGVKPNAEQLNQIAKLVDENKVRVRVGLALPLSEVRKAHEKSTSGEIAGKIVLTIP